MQKAKQLKVFGKSDMVFLLCSPLSSADSEVSQLSTLDLLSSILGDDASFGMLKNHGVESQCPTPSHQNSI